MTEAHLTPHQLVLNDRKRLDLTGVADVDSFDDRTVVARTALGELTVRGQALSVCRLSIDSGDLSIEGTIDSLEYTTVEPHKGGLFRRMFK